MDTTSFGKHLPLGHVTLHYLDYGGTGPRSVVLLHGGGANAHWFDWVGPQLVPYCRAFALDLRGHGDSSSTEPPVYTYDAYLEDIRALLSAERIQAPILLGHSMGGMLLVKYTSTWPQEVGALVVCDAMPVYSLEAADRLQQTGQRQGREYETLEEYITHYRIRPDGLRAPPEVHRHIARHAACQRLNGRWAHKIDRRVYAQRQAIDTWPYWCRITCPVLVLRAEYSPRLTPAILQQMKAACPHVEVATVADAGHHLVLDQPEQTVALVLEFLRRHRLIDDQTSSPPPSSIPG